MDSFIERLRTLSKNPSPHPDGQLLYMCQDVRPTPRRAAFGAASSRIPDGMARQGVRRG